MNFTQPLVAMLAQSLTAFLFFVTPAPVIANEDIVLTVWVVPSASTEVVNVSVPETAEEEFFLTGPDFGDGIIMKGYLNKQSLVDLITPDPKATKLRYFEVNLYFVDTKTNRTVKLIAALATHCGTPNSYMALSLVAPFEDSVPGKVQFVPTESEAAKMFTTACKVPESKVTSILLMDGKPLVQNVEAHNERVLQGLKDSLK